MDRGTANDQFIAAKAEEYNDTHEWNEGMSGHDWSVATFKAGATLMVNENEALRFVVKEQKALIDRLRHVVQTLTPALKAATRHSCYEWDELVIDFTKPEFDACKCLNADIYTELEKLNPKETS